MLSCARTPPLRPSKFHPSVGIARVARQTFSLSTSCDRRASKRATPARRARDGGGRSGKPCAQGGYRRGRRTLPPRLARRPSVVQRHWHCQSCGVNLLPAVGVRVDGRGAAGAAARNLRPCAGFAAGGGLECAWAIRTCSVVAPTVPCDWRRFVRVAVRSLRLRSRTLLRPAWQRQLSHPSFRGRMPRMAAPVAV